MWQHLLVLCLVALSTVYATWSLLPPAARGRVRTRLISAARRLPAPAAALGERLLRPSAGLRPGGCSACPASAPRSASAARR